VFLLNHSLLFIQTLISYFLEDLSHVLLLEHLHESDKCFNTFNSHGVVKRSAAATNRTMTRQLDKVQFSGISNEFLGQIVGFFYQEGKVHAGAVLLLNNVLVETFRSINVFVKHVGALDCKLLHLGKAALFKHILNIKSSHVDSPA
jgi:hypothetical protein